MLCVAWFSNEPIQAILRILYIVHITVSLAVLSTGYQVNYMLTLQCCIIPLFRWGRSVGRRSRCGSWSIAFGRSRWSTRICRCWRGRILILTSAVKAALNHELSVHHYAQGNFPCYNFFGYSLSRVYFTCVESNVARIYLSCYSSRDLTFMMFVIYFWSNSYTWESWNDEFYVLKQF